MLGAPHRAPARVAALRFAVLFSLLAVLASPRTARAHRWMIRHDYTGCAMCHVAFGEDGEFLARLGHTQQHGIAFAYSGDLIRGEIGLLSRRRCPGS